MAVKAEQDLQFNNIQVDGYSDLQEIAAPAAPAAGFVRVYPKTDGKLYIKDDAGTETDLTSAGGGGGGGITSINNQTGTSYTLTASDEGALVRMDNASTNRVTVPTNTSVPFSTGAIVRVRQAGEGATILASSATVKVNGSSEPTGGQGAGGYLIKVATNEWDFFGNLASGYSGEILLDRPLAYWRLGEVSGSAAYDSSGNQSDGTYTNSPTLGVSPLINSNNLAASFDGTDDYVSCPALSPSSSGRSLELWAKADNSTSVYRVISFNAQSPWFLLVFNQGGTANKIRMIVEDNAGTQIADVPAGTVDTTVTHHYVMTATESGTAYLYIDGVQQASVAVGTFSQNANDPNNRIGQGRAGVEPFPGVIDEVAFYDKALTSADVTRHYDAGL